jgi:type I restriction enzyme S subunit
VKMPAYPKYKPSGVEWLGDVPEKWEVKRLKTSATCWVSNVDKVPAEDELPVRLCNYTDVYYHDHITPDMELMETTATADEIRRFGLRESDVVITKDSEEWSDIAVPALVKKSAPDLVCGYHLAIIRPRPKVLYGDFLLRAFQSCAINQQFQVAASGVTRYGLPKASIGDAWFPLPDTAEQQTIAAFLDCETARLDTLVAKKQKLIQRLKEKRTALISRTVRRGLNPNAKLKSSGITWLGDIPTNWDARRLKEVGTLLGGAGFPYEEQGVEGEELPFYKVGDLKASLDGRMMGKPEHTISKETAKKLRASIIPPDSIVYAKIGAALLLNRRRITVINCCIDNNMTAYVPGKKHIETNWAFYWLSILDFGEFMNPGAVPSFSEGYQSILSILVPSLPEQTAITEYLDAETKKLDALVSKVETAIERLQEYRTALITAAVTGKIDVRKAA